MNITCGGTKNWNNLFLDSKNMKSVIRDYKKFLVNLDVAKGILKKEDSRAVMKAFDKTQTIL